MHKIRLKTRKYALPATVDGICALVREIILEGRVKRVELDTDDSFVRAHQWVEADSLEEDLVSWDGALRNVAELREYYGEGALPSQVVVDMLLLAQEAGLQGVCWATGASHSSLLKEWLAVDQRKLQVTQVDHLLGLPIQRLKSLPEETLILCCAKYKNADPEDIVMAVKTSIEIGNPYGTQSVEAVNRGGGNPQKHNAGVSQLVLTATGLRRVAWSPPSKAGHSKPRGG